MQALSQLSYGPTMLEAEFYAAAKRSPSLFSEITNKEEARGRTTAEAGVCPGECIDRHVEKHAANDDHGLVRHK
jgi:hypothetical protein